MRVDFITEVGIDDLDRQYIKPEVERFTMVYRTGTEVHWDEKELFLYSPKPREWSYFDWYKHIIGVVETECNCTLTLNSSTKWINISDELRSQIINSSIDIAN